MKTPKPIYTDPRSAQLVELIRMRMTQYRWKLKHVAPEAGINYPRMSNALHMKAPIKLRWLKGIAPMLALPVKPIEHAISVVGEDATIDAVFLSCPDYNQMPATPMKA